MSIVSVVTNKVASAYAKRFGNGINYTRKIAGVPVTTNIKTGTRIARGAYGKDCYNHETKLIELGKGNRLRKELGIKSLIKCSGDIFISMKNKRIGIIAEQFSKEEFAKFISGLRNAKKNGEKVADKFARNSLIGWERSILSYNKIPGYRGESFWNTQRLFNFGRQYEYHSSID